MRAGTLIFVALLSGCSLVNDPGVHQEPGDGGATGMDASARDAGSGITAEAYCDAYATDVCQSYQDCCDTPETYLACEDDLRAACLEIFTDLPPYLSFDGARAETALATGRGYISTCDTALASWAVTPDGFLSPIVGTLEPDQVCTPIGGEAGAARALRSCAEPNVCLPVTATEWRCRPRRADGEACTYGFECTSNRCNFNGVLAQDRCGDGNAIGENCQMGRRDQCNSLLCVRSPPGMIGYRCSDLTQQALYCVGPPMDG